WLAPSSLQLDRQPVDLGGEDEVVLRQPAQGVRPQLDRHVAVADQVQVGVVVLLLRDLADAGEEAQAGREVLDDPLAADAAAVVAQLPVGQGGEEALDLLGRQRGDAALARLAASLSQLGGARHGGSPPLTHCTAATTDSPPEWAAAPLDAGGPPERIAAPN